MRRHVEQTLKNDVYATQGYRGENYIVPLPNGATLSSLSIDLNNDGTYGDGETFTEATVAIPAGAAAGLVKARLVLDDQTVLNYQLALADNITEARTVSVSLPAASRARRSGSGLPCFAPFSSARFISRSSGKASVCWGTPAAAGGGV